MKYFILLLAIVATVTMLEHLIEFHARLMERIAKDEPLDFDDDGVPTWLILTLPFLWILYSALI